MSAFSDPEVMAALQDGNVSSYNFVFLLIFEFGQLLTNNP